jgi:hypothetical protein
VNGIIKCLGGEAQMRPLYIPNGLRNQYDVLEVVRLHASPPIHLPFCYNMYGSLAHFLRGRRKKRGQEHSECSYPRTYCHAVTYPCVLPQRKCQGCLMTYLQRLFSPHRPHKQSYQTQLDVARSYMDGRPCCGQGYPPYALQ